MRRLMLLLLSSVSVLGFSFSAYSKTMESRLGLGFHNSFPFEMPAMAAHYYPNSNFGMTGALGIDTQENNSKFGLQIGLRKRVFEEDQLNFYMGGSFSLLTQEIAGAKKSGYELAALVACEFFLTGLDNLGFNVETGVAASNMDAIRFRTVGNSFLNSGIIFYF